MPISLEPNPDWINKGNRPACKYSPVVVSKRQLPTGITDMKNALDTRVKVCKASAVHKNKWLRSANWFSFLRGGPSHEPHLNQSSVPIIVLSSQCSAKLKDELQKRIRLAWHPAYVHDQPVYLLVHRTEYKTYAAALTNALSTYRNLHLTGWDGGGMAGFGASRAAALALADTLPYRPKRILLLDQDVLSTKQVGVPAFLVNAPAAHAERNKQIIALGTGYPTRIADSAIKNAVFGKVDAPAPQDFNSPAQQAVSIQAPFRKPGGSPFALDGPYPAYMVAGGEDMLMSLQLGLGDVEGRTGPFLSGRIQKMGLDPKIPMDPAPAVDLKKKLIEDLYQAEKDTPVTFAFEPDKPIPLTIERLLEEFRKLTWIEAAEVQQTSALIVERIILRLYKLDPSRFTEYTTKAIF